MEYARISHVVSTALRGGVARPCHSQARAVLNVHRVGSAKRLKAIALQPAARVQHQYRALTLLFHPDRTASELLRHRTMARLAWDAVQTARTYLDHTGRVDEYFSLEQRRPPATPFTGLWLPVPHADSAAFLNALSHTPATLVPTRPRGLPDRLVRTTSLTLARPALALGLSTPNAPPPVSDLNSNIMSRSHSLPSSPPPAWHVAPAILDFSQDDHDDLHGSEERPPSGPQYRLLLLNPGTRTAPPLCHNLDLALNDSDVRFIASRHAATAASSDARRRRHQHLVTAVDSPTAPAPFPRAHVATLYGQFLYSSGAEPLDLRWTIALYTQHQVSTELSGASFPVTDDPRSIPYAISGAWDPLDLTCTLSIHRDNSTRTHTLAGRMRWTPTGLVIVGTWALDADDDAMVATPTIGDFSCSEVPTPPHRHTTSHPAGLWMGVHVPGLGITTAQGVTPAAHCHLIAHIDTTLDHWFGVGFDPAGDFLAFNGTATPVVAQPPDDRTVRVSLCASVRKDDETVHFTAFGSVVGGHVQDIYGATPAPWRGHRVLGAGEARPAGDELLHSSRPPPHGRAPATSDDCGSPSPAVRVDTQTDMLTDLESLAGSDDDDDGRISADNGEAGPSHHEDVCAHPHITHSSRGGAAQKPPVAERPARPVSPLAAHGARPAQAAPHSVARSATAYAPLAPPGLGPCAHSPARAHGDYAGGSGGMGPRAPTPTLVRLTKNDASPPLGPSGTHASAHTPSMTPPRAAGHASDGDGTCQVPTGAAPRSAEYITSFLQHIRHGAASKAAAPAGVSQPPPPASSVADDGAVAASPVTATRKRKARSR